MPAELQAHFQQAATLIAGAELDDGLPSGLHQSSSWLGEIVRPTLPVALARAMAKRER